MPNAQNERAVLLTLILISSPSRIVVRCSNDVGIVNKVMAIDYRQTAHTETNVLNDPLTP